MSTYVPMLIDFIEPSPLWSIWMQVLIQSLTILLLDFRCPRPLALVVSRRLFL